MEKICNCGYETNKKRFNFCPLCGNKLTTLELESDGTYKAERSACRVINDDWINPNRIYYYKVSLIDKELVWIYESLTSSHFIFGCHISKVVPLKLERIKRCALRENDECGHTSSCKICKVYRGEVQENILKSVNIVNR